MAFTTSPKNRNHGILSVGLTLIGLILSLSSPAHLSAQEVGATLFGTITDAGGASVPDASVTVNDPPMYAATVLAETFANCGIRVTGNATRDRTAKQALGSSPADHPSFSCHIPITNSS